MVGAARVLALGFARLALCTLGVVACGSNTPTIPPELLASSGGCASPDYPDGPFGSEEGDTLANACFKGFRNPVKVSHDEASLETVAFSDYYDPTGSKGFQLVLIDTSAVWCSACRTEHEGLSAKNDEYSPKGLRIVGTLFEDVNHDPATVQDLSNWVETFSSDYAMVLDPDYQLGTYASADTAPLNMVVNARTMKIEKKLLGDQPTVLWPFIDASLAD
jgi:AhpC/TSA family